MRFPLDKGTYWISQGYHGITKKQPWEHWGIDLATNGATSGNPVKAPEDGQITQVYSLWTGAPGDYFGGNYIVMVGKSGYRYYMGHNKKNHVKLWQNVKEGDHIADVGMTGQADGPHIHLEMSKNGVTHDPLKLLEDEEEEEAMIDKTTHKNVFLGILNRNPRADEVKRDVGKRTTTEVVNHIRDYSLRSKQDYGTVLAAAKAKQVTSTIKLTTLKPGVYEVK